LSSFLTQYPNSTYAITHSSIRYWLLTHTTKYFACNIKYEKEYESTFFLLNSICNRYLFCSCCFKRKGHTRLTLYLSRSLNTPLHGPEALECIRHLSLSDLFGENLNKICQQMKTLIDEPSRLLGSLRNAFYPELDISELLLMASANPDTYVDSIHMPLLCIAAQHGYLSFITLLLKYHVNINIRTKNNENKTALILAAEYGHEDVVQLLIQSNADVS
jgi:ankyrin repeat protein